MKPIRLSGHIVSKYLFGEDSKKKLQKQYGLKLGRQLN